MSSKIKIRNKVSLPKHAKFNAYSSNSLFNLSNYEDYENKRKLSKSSNDTAMTMYEEVPIDDYTNQDFLEEMNEEDDDKIWGYIFLNGFYNKFKETIEIEIISVHPSKKCIKLNRSYSMKMQLFGEKLKKPAYHSLDFVLSKQRRPRRKIWLIENILLHKLKNVTVKVKLMRRRVRKGVRVLSKAEFNLQDLCFNYSTKKMQLEMPRIYVDKPKIKVINKNNPQADVDEDKSDSSFGSIEGFNEQTNNIQLCFVRQLFSEPQILLGLKYDSKIALLYVNIIEYDGINFFKPKHEKYIGFEVELLKAKESTKYYIESYKKVRKPFKYKILTINLTEENLDQGHLRFRIRLNTYTIQSYLIDIDRAENDHWTEMLLQSSKELFYRWHMFNVIENWR